nr:E3 ubiquitin-protein ligase synoviolin B-like [Leptinotarsa decemlineata]
MRTASISLISALLTTIVVANAYLQKKQFYPSVVYITKSNPSMAVIYIQAFVGVWMTGKIMTKLFFGQLRPAELEHLMERSWYAVTETCLAFTVFRDDFNPKFVTLFTLLLFLKAFHWLVEDRVDYMERSPIISLLFHARLLTLLTLLGFLDIYFSSRAYQVTVTKGASVQLVFGFEYAILLTILVNTTIKYILHYVDLNSESPWDNKAVFLLHTELVIGLVKVMLYGAFMTIMVRIYSLPLFALRPMYYAIRDFKKAFSDVVLSRRAIHNMNNLYPDATGEELQSVDNVCIICREEMTSASKKLPCNHIFHTTCLRSWFQRQQTCPTCRLNILQTPSNPTRRQPPAAPPHAAPGNHMFLGHNIYQMFNQPEAENFQRQQQERPTEQQRQQTPLPPQFMMPPFPFLPFLPPPPMPAPNFAELSVEELRAMEGSEKENVEARIQCLRNIQILLDTAVTMMQQYSAAASHYSQIPTAATSSPSNPFQASFPSASGFNNSTPKVAKVAPTTSSPQVSTTHDWVESTSDGAGPSKENVEEIGGVQAEEEAKKLQECEAVGLCPKEE